MTSPQVTADFDAAATAARDGGTAVSGMAMDALGRRAVSGLEDHFFCLFRSYG